MICDICGAEYEVRTKRLSAGDSSMYGMFEKIKMHNKVHVEHVTDDKYSVFTLYMCQECTDELIDYTEINQWDGKLPTYMAGGDSTTVPVLDLSAQ